MDERGMAIKMAVAKEREACAKLVAALAKQEEPGSKEQFSLNLAASAIRARKP